MKHFITMLVVLFALTAQPAAAQTLYNVTDGNIADWGVTFTADGWKKGYLDTTLPSGGNDIDKVTEDTADKNSPSNTLVDPGYTKGNTYDAEAMYFDNDRNYGYIAIATGLSPNEHDYPAGDIFLDTGLYQNSGVSAHNKLYEYVIDISESKLYRLKHTTSHSAWINTTSYSAGNPWQGTNESSKRTYISDVVMRYSPTAIQTHYFLETRFSLDSIGLDADEDDVTRDLWLHWTMKCGNDVLNLKADVNQFHTPEPTSLALLMTGLGLGFKRFRRKK